MGEQGFDTGGKIDAKFFKKRPAICFGKPQRRGGGLNETARGLMSVAEETLAQRQGINRECQTVNQSMPPTGFVLLDGGEVALNKALVAQWSEALKLALADVAAGGSEILQYLFTGQFLVEGNQLTQFITTGVEKGTLNGRQLQWLQNVGMIILQEYPQLRQMFDLPDWR